MDSVSYLNVLIGVFKDYGNFSRDLAASSSLCTLTAQSKKNDSASSSRSSKRDATSESG